MPAPRPQPAADVILELPDERLVLVKRRNPPFGWALPGGFIEYGERAEAAAVREAFEETGLHVDITGLFHVYSDPQRDPRGHTLAIVYVGRADGEPHAGDDAAKACAFPIDALPSPLAFDHHAIIQDYVRFRRTGRRPLEHGPRPPHISASERAALLSFARSSIAAHLGIGQPPSTHDATGILAKPSGVFVSLHHRGALRGCIGTFARERPLAAEVCAMAVAAAFEDQRFSPLERSELEGLEIEISVLSRPVRGDPRQIVIGEHGVSICRGASRGVFLPQVAPEAGWDRDLLLREVCLKAGLEADAWRDAETALAIFTATIVREQA